MAKVEKVLVRMDDGRDVGFGKAQKVIKVVMFQPDGKAPRGIQFDGANGDMVRCEFEDLPDYNWLHSADPEGVSLWAAVHGYLQKLGDEYASLDKVEDCLEAVQSLWARLCENRWDSETRGFGGSALLLDAVLLAFPHMQRDEARKLLDGMKPNERLTLQLTAEVKPHFDRLQAERAKGDATKLLEKFQK